MGLVTFGLIVVVILAVIGLGPIAFWDGIKNGYDKAIQIAGPIAQNLTQEAQELVAEESTNTVKEVIVN